MFFPKILKVATATLFFSNPFLIEFLHEHRVPFTESFVQAQTLSSSSRQTVPNQWQTFTSQDAYFTVLMPAGDLNQDTVEQSSGDIKFQIQTFSQSDRNGINYWVAYTDFLPFAPQSLTPDEAELFFNSFTQGMVSRIPEGEVRSRREMTLNGFIGQEIEIQNPAGALIKIRVYFGNSRIYMLFAAIPHPSLAQSPNIDQFLNSFNLVNHQVSSISKKQTKN